MARSRASAKLQCICTRYAPAGHAAQPGCQCTPLQAQQPPPHLHSLQRTQKAPSTGSSSPQAQAGAQRLALTRESGSLTLYVALKVNSLQL